MNVFTEKDKSAILKERATRLAQPLQKGKKEKDLELLEFQLADERYALELFYIREAYPLKDYSPLPCSPPFVFGVINIRRRILALLDLRKILDLPTPPPTDKSKAILLANREKEFAILVDAMIGVRAASFNDLQTSLPTLSGVKQEFLKGLTTDGLIVLDGEKLLNSKTLIVQETVDF